MLKAGNTTGRGKIATNATIATVTLATKIRIAKREFSPYGALGGDLREKAARRIGPYCGSYQSDIAAT